MSKNILFNPMKYNWVLHWLITLNIPPQPNPCVWNQILASSFKLRNVRCLSRLTIKVSECVRENGGIAAWHWEPRGGFRGGGGSSPCVEVRGEEAGGATVGRGPLG